MKDYFIHLATVLISGRFNTLQQRSDERGINMIAIIDYDAGNLKSVEKALQHLGEEVVITRDHDEIKKADKVILPGVGAFGDAMQKLHHYQLVDTIKEVVAKNTPLLGICLGLQLLFERSEETEGVEGLSILKGNIVRIPDKEGLKIPHIGWNSLRFTKDSRLFKGLDQDAYVYFVHSYYLHAANAQDVAATTEYSTTLDVAVEKDNVYACQFHPEKSGDVGLAILKNFANIGKE
jgi:imidazole glycerol-phosphate synthase subunit HisH